MKPKRVRGRMSQRDIDRVAGQEGGVVQITYRGATVVSPLRGLDEALEAVRETTAEERAVAMLRLNQALDRRYADFQAGRATPVEAIEMAMDVTLWLANEIVEGRQAMPTPLDRTELDAALAPKEK